MSISVFDHTPTVTPDPAATQRYGRWECAGQTGRIIVAGDGFVADSPSVITNGRARPSGTMDEAARRAYHREVLVAPALDGVRRKYRIDLRAAAAVYAVDANDPAAEFDGEPDKKGRYTNLLPWEREAVKVARENRSLSVLVKDGDTVHLFAVAGKHVTIIRTENGAEVGRWRVLDGCRRVALFWPEISRNIPDGQAGIFPSHHGGTTP